MLRELQETMRAALWDAGSASAADSLLVTHRGLSAEQRVGIYRDSILGGLTKALTEIYPVCRRLVGERFFEAMCERYVRGHPSGSADLNRYGDAMNAFIANFAPAASLPYLPDVARLEWAWHRAWYLSGETTLDLEAMNRIPAEQRARIRFRLPDGATLIDSAYPIERIWTVNQSDYHGDPIADLGEGGAHLLIWRDREHRRIDPLDQPQWTLLARSAAGQSLGQLWQSLEHSGADVGVLLGEVLARSWIGGFELMADD